MLLRKRCRTRATPFRLLARLLFVFAFVAGALGLAAQERGPQTGPRSPALVLTVDGAITPATSDYITRGLDTAEGRGAPLAVLRMNTPGGLDTSMREIIRAILASPVPVAGFVGPPGSRAASAGTYIMYASHIAAMAPATNLGAATPVAIGGGGGDDGGGLPFGLQTDDQREAGDAGQAQDEADASPTQSATEAKMINDAVAYIRGLADLRGRNADWAERAVRQAESLGSREAAELNVIDFVAADIDELLALADGMTVSTAGGEVTLQTAGLGFEMLDPDWRTQILSVITDPNIALILMMVGIYGLILEFLNPGVLVPGTVGGISLVLGMYSLALLPLNYAGVLLIVLGIALIVAEAFAPSFGILGIGGTAAVVLGAVILVDTDVPGVAVSTPLIAAVAVAGLVVTLIVARLAARSFSVRVVSGREDLIGAEARVLKWTGDKGHVWLNGERWQAKGPEGLKSDDTVRVTGISGLVVNVERVGDDAPA